MTTNPAAGDEPPADRFWEPDPEVVKYLTSIEPGLNGAEELDAPPDETVDAMELLVGNVLEEICGQEAALAANSDCSRVLEAVLRRATDAQIAAFFAAVAGDLVPLAKDRFGSHVVEALLQAATGAMEREADGGALQTLFLSACRALERDAFGFLTDPFASHVLRTLLNVLCGGGLFAADATRSKRSKRYRNSSQIPGGATAAAPASGTTKFASARALGPAKKVPVAFHDALVAMVHALAQQTNGTELRILAAHRTASPALALLLRVQYLAHKGVIATSDAVDPAALQPTLLPALFGLEAGSPAPTERDPALDALICGAVGSHVLETAVEVAPAAAQTWFFETYLSGRVRDLSLEHQGNFIVSHLLGSAPSEAVLVKMLDELAPAKAPVVGRQFEKLIRQRKHGVLVELARACVRFRTGFDRFIEHLRAAFGINDESPSETLARCIVHMQHASRFDVEAATPDESETSPLPKLQYAVAIAGSQLFAALLRFPSEHSRSIVDSYLAIPLPVRVAYACDTAGSRALEGVFSSAEIARKTKARLFMPLIDRAWQLAADRNGGHVIDAAWHILGLEYRTRVAEVLLQHYNKIVAAYHGKFVLRNCRIDDFRKSRKEWAAQQQASENRKRVLQDFLDNVDSAGR